jgi:hypothetical protein
MILVIGRPDAMRRRKVGVVRWWKRIGMTRLHGRVGGARGGVVVRTGKGASESDANGERFKRSCGEAVQELTKMSPAGRGRLRLDVD